MKKYKRFLILLACFLLVVISVGISASAHPGGTDANGGHHDRSTGEYHYHHGFGPHEHDGDTCPLDPNYKPKHSVYEGYFAVGIAGIFGAAKIYDIIKNK